MLHLDVYSNVLNTLEQKANLGSALSIMDKKLQSSLIYLIEKHTPQLQGEYDMHNVYANEEGEIYGLVYATYRESVSVSTSNFKELLEKDCLYLQRQLIKSRLNIDYFLVVPYYYYADRKLGMIMMECIFTKIFNREE